MTVGCSVVASGKVVEIAFSLQGVCDRGLFSGGWW